MHMTFWKLGLITIALFDGLFTYNLLTNENRIYEEANWIIAYFISIIGIEATLILRTFYILGMVWLLDYATKRTEEWVAWKAYLVVISLYFIIYFSFMNLH